MIITLTPKLRMRLERDCYILEEETIVKATKTKPEHETWTFVGYYMDPANAFERAVRLLLGQYVDATPISVAEYVRMLHDAATTIRAALAPYSAKKPGNVIDMSGAPPSEAKMREAARLAAEQPLANVTLGGGTFPITPLSPDGDRAAPPAPRGRSPRKLE